MVETVETATLSKSPATRSNVLQKAQSAQNVAKRKLEQVMSEPIIRDKVEVPFISPFVHVDVTYDKAVLQLRDSSSGEVLEQLPSRQVLETRRLDRARSAAEIDQKLSDPLGGKQATQIADSNAILIEAQQAAQSTAKVQAQPQAPTQAAVSAPPSAPAVAAAPTAPAAPVAAPAPASVTTEA